MRKSLKALIVAVLFGVLSLLLFIYTGLAYRGFPLLTTTGAFIAAGAAVLLWLEEEV